MVTMDEMTDLVSALPEVRQGVRYGHLAWSVAGRTFAWERPFSKADLKRFGDETPPAGPIVAVSVADLGEKEAILAANTKAFFTIPHFDNYPALLIALDQVSEKALREALVDGWLVCAPRRLAQDYLGHNS